MSEFPIERKEEVLNFEAINENYTEILSQIMLLDGNLKNTLPDNPPEVPILEQIDIDDKYSLELALNSLKDIQIIYSYYPNNVIDSDYLGNSIYYANTLLSQIEEFSLLVNEDLSQAEEKVTSLINFLSSLKDILDHDDNSANQVISLFK